MESSAILEIALLAANARQRLSRSKPEVQYCGLQRISGEGRELIGSKVKRNTQTSNAPSISM